MIRALRLVILLVTRHSPLATFLFLLFAVPASAQVATGTPPFGSFAGGPEFINLGNLNAHWTIPVLHKSGRGTNFNYDIVYDSSVWYPVGSGGNQSWVPVANWGWFSNSVFSSALAGYVTYYYSSTYCYDQMGHPNGTDVLYDSYVYHDPWGINHTFGGVYEVKSGGCGSSTTNTFPSTATDASGYVIQNITGPLLSKGGANVGAPFNFGSGQYASSYTDRNGNQINNDANGHFYDTMSSTTAVLTVSGAAPNPTTFTYTAPSGASASYTMKYTNYTVQTNFGCSGIADYGTNGTTTAYLVSEIDLPDSSKYTFNYEATPGHTGNVTGRLASITLPAGGTIYYSYSGGSSGHITCADGSAATLTRTTPDTGTNYWTYAHSQVSGTHWQTTVTDPTTPTANQTLIDFQKDSASITNTNNFYETQRQVYQGSTSGTLLRTLVTCYNNNASNCTTTAVSSPVTQRNVNDQYGSSGLQCEHDYYYNAVGGLSEQDDFDYGSGGHGALLRKILITYASLGNITAFQRIVTVCNGTGTSSSCQGASGSSTGTVVSQTNYNYDEGTLSTTSNVAQHNSVTGSRGNLTSIYPTASLVTHFTYYDTGSPNTSTDLNGATKTYNYTSNLASCQMAFPNGISEPLSMSITGGTWNCGGGVITAITDENSQQTTTTYNDQFFWRPASLGLPDGGQASWTYNSPTSVTTTLKMNSTQNAVGTLLLDGLGRPKQVQLNSDPQGVDYTDTTYDPLGRVASVSNLYRSTSDPTYGVTSYQYDALGRTTKVTFPEGSVSTISYSNNTITSTDPAGKAREAVYDSLGRTTQVFEDPGSSPHLNYETDYSYDALGNLLCAAQKGTNSGTFSGCSSIPATWRPRTFGYDALSRLTSESTPEAGSVTYSYNSNGDLATRVAPAPNQTSTATVTISYCFDALHRITAKAYTYSPNSPPTCSGTPPTFSSPAATFTYDVSSLDGDSAFTNTVGRLVRATTTGTSPTKTYFSYDSMGRVLYLAQCAVVNCGNWGSSPNWWVIANTFDLTGNLTSYTDGQTNTFTQKFDAAGRPWQLTSSWADSNHPQNLYTVGTTTQPNYNAPGSVSTALFGNNLTAAYAYNSQVQPCRIDWNTSAQSLANCGTATPSTSILDFSYGFNAGTSDNGNIASWSAAGQQTFTRSFTYDSLNRLATMQETNGNAEGCKPASSSSSPYNLTWTIDAWGSRTAQSPNSGTCSFSQAVNSQNQFSTSPYAYDAAGNMTQDASHTYSYDAENRLQSVDGGTTAAYLYNAGGQRVAKGTSSSWATYYLYGIDGQVVSDTLSNGTTWNQTYIRFAGQFVAQYRGTATAFILQDHLGSTRLDTAYPWVSTSQSIYDNMDYLPFGEEIAGGTATSHKFTGDERDTETNLDHAWFRQYSSNTGRWMTPDPAGLAAVDPSNPQSWNRYAYVGNGPLNLVDPTGLLYGPCGPMDLLCCPPNCDDGSGGGANDAGIGTFGGGAGAEGMEDPGSFLWCVRNLHSMGVKGNLAALCRPPKTGGDVLTKVSDTAKAFGSCTGQHFGLTAATAGTAALGAPVSKAALNLPTGMAGASDTMSLSSAIEWKLFGAAGPKIGVNILGTTRLFGVIGRAATFVSGALAILDARQIGACMDQKLGYTPPQGNDSPTGN